MVKNLRFHSLGNIPPVTKFEISVKDGLFLVLQPHKKQSPGINNIPSEFLTRYGEFCSNCLSVIFKYTRSTAKIPVELKYASS